MSRARELSDHFSATAMASRRNNFVEPHFGNPKSSAYEKKYFQHMLARLQRRSAPPPSSRHQPPPRATSRVTTGALSAGHKTSSSRRLFSTRKLRSVSPAMSSREAELAAGGAKPCQKSLSFEQQVYDGQDEVDEGKAMQVVGTRSFMSSRSSLRSSTPDMESPSLARRRLLNKIQRKLKAAQDQLEPIKKSGMTTSRSLSEISNLVVELENNLRLHRCGGSPNLVANDLEEDSQVPGDEESLHRQRSPNVVMPDICNNHGNNPGVDLNEDKIQGLLVPTAHLEVPDNKDKHLGKGAFAKVFRANLYDLDVAVKAFYMDKKKDNRAMSRAETEAGILVTLRHPNIVQLIGLTSLQVKHCSNLCLILELMPGGSLRKLLEDLDTSMDLQMLFSIAKDLCLALLYLHNLVHPIVHLDVKSSNVLLDGSKFRAKLADFGFAKMLPSQTSKIMLDGVKGSPAWMAPEVIFVRKIDLKADVFSFAMVVWEMLSRKKPFQGLTFDEVSQCKLRGVNPVIDHTAEVKVRGISDLLNSCWHVEPSFRPTMREVLQQLMSVEQESLKFCRDRPKMNQLERESYPELAADVSTRETTPNPDALEGEESPWSPPSPFQNFQVTSPAVLEAQLDNVPTPPAPPQTSSVPRLKQFVIAKKFQVTKEDLVKQKLRLRKIEKSDESSRDFLGKDLLSVMKRALNTRRKQLTGSLGQLVQAGVAEDATETRQPCTDRLEEDGQEEIHCVSVQSNVADKVIMNPEDPPVVPDQGNDMYDMYDKANSDGSLEQSSGHSSWSETQGY